MRRTLLILITACGPLPGPDGGTHDAGAPSGDAGSFVCTPAAPVCVGSDIWACTFSGRDAVWVEDCDRGIGGLCSLSPCDGGQPAYFGQTFCCFP